MTSSVEGGADRETTADGSSSEELSSAEFVRISEEITHSMMLNLQRNSRELVSEEKEPAMSEEVMSGVLSGLTASTLSTGSNSGGPLESSSGNLWGADWSPLIPVSTVSRPLCPGASAMAGATPPMNHNATVTLRPVPRWSSPEAYVMQRCSTHHSRYLQHLPQLAACGGAGCGSYSAAVHYGMFVERALQSSSAPTSAAQQNSAEGASTPDF